LPLCADGGSGFRWPQALSIQPTHTFSKAMLNIALEEDLGNSTEAIEDILALPVVRSSPNQNNHLALL
jgi:hypothetical protein